LVQTTSLETSDEKPFAVIDISNRLKHVLGVGNQTITGTSRAKPSNAVRAEVWRKLGDPPSGDSDVEYVGLATRSPFTIEYAADESGKTAHYMMRWVGSDGEKGSWSETESATIAA
jgi:hypothetical protein